MIRLAFKILTHEPRKLTASSGVAAICTFMGDLLEPLLNFTELAIALFLFLTAASLFKLSKWIRGHSECKDSPDAVPSGLRLILSLGVAGLILSTAMWTWQLFAGKPDSGVLASSVPALENMQVQLGLINRNLENIESGLEEIDEGLEDIDVGLEEIDDSLGDVEEELVGIRTEVAAAKKETSDNPRKELANMGVTWSAAAFAEALKSQDETTVSLFMDGGINPTAPVEGASALLHGIDAGGTGAVSMVKLLLEKGYDPNRPLSDETLLDRNAINPFEHDPMPEGYAAWNQQYGGPVLLWLTLRMTWEGGRESDWAIVQALLDHGADPALPRAYLESNKRALGGLDDTGTYERLVAAMAK